MNEHMRIFVRELLDFASQAVSSSGQMDANDLVRLHRKLAEQSMALLTNEALEMDEGATRQWIENQREVMGAYWRDSK
jgi:hypothetical protein